MTITVASMEMQFMTKVNSRYFAISGSTNEVGGKIFETRSRNTTNDSRIEMPSVTFSPASKQTTRSVNSIQYTAQLVGGCPVKPTGHSPIRAQLKLIDRVRPGWSNCGS